MTKVAPMRALRRVWHPHHLWEDAAAGVWRKVGADERAALRVAAAAFMADADAFHAVAVRVTREWRYACEHNLSDRGINRVAWLGHAAVVLATRCPEDVTREAWWTLTQPQRDAGDRVVGDAVDAWEADYLGRAATLPTPASARHAHPAQLILPFGPPTRPAGGSHA